MLPWKGGLAKFVKEIRQKGFHAFVQAPSDGHRGREAATPDECI